MSDETILGLRQVVQKIQVGIARSTPSADNENYSAVTLTIAEAHIVLTAINPDQTQAADPHVDRLVNLITRSLAGGGCSNCGAIPHTSTCRVGRLAAALYKQAAHEQEELPVDWLGL